MRCVALGIALSFLTAGLNSGYASREARASIASDGEYIGLERMPNLTPEDPDSAWFHENTLVIGIGQAILDKVPITICRGSKTYAASDGGLLACRARFIVKDGLSVVEMRLMGSMYIIFRIDKRDEYTEIKTYAVSSTAGSIEFDGVRYRPTVLKKIELDRPVHLLNTEPLENANAER